jgi:hypothetical protein
MKPVCIAIIFLLSTAISAFCDDFYVSTAGSDSNPGTQAQPFATIQHAINVCPAMPGASLIHLDASTWNESPTIHSKQICITGDYNGPNGMGGRTTSIINGIIRLWGTANWGYQIKQLTAKKIEIEDTVMMQITIDTCNITYSSEDGIQTDTDPGAQTLITVTNCLIAYCSDIGINAMGPGQTLTVDLSIIHDCGNNGINGNIGYAEISNNYIYNCSGDAMNLTIVDTGYSSNISDNEVYSNSGCGIRFINSGRYRVYDNLIHNNQNYGIYIDGISNPDFGGGAQNSPGNNTISGNGTYEVYNDSPNLIYAKYNYWDPLSEAEMAGHTYLEVNVSRIFDHWDDASKGYVNWDEPGTHTKVVPMSLGQLKASYAR